jgi:hypothetical protein
MMIQAQKDQKSASFHKKNILYGNFFKRNFKFDKNHDEGSWFDSIPTSTETLLQTYEYVPFFYKLYSVFSSFRYFNFNFH